MDTMTFGDVELESRFKKQAGAHRTDRNGCRILKRRSAAITSDNTGASPSSFAAMFTSDDGDAPVWPGDVSCAPRPGTTIFDAYSLAPAGLPEGSLQKGTLENTCSMVCLPKGVIHAAEKHGVHIGSSCFGTNDSSVYPSYGDGTAIPEGTPICPGAKYVKTGKTAGVEWCGPAHSR